jgi:phage shock protein C
MYNRVRRVKQKDAKLTGVCGGLSKYIDPEMDPFIIRLIWILLTIFSGFVFMTFLYFILSLVLKVED